MNRVQGPATKSPFPSSLRVIFIFKSTLLPQVPLRSEFDDSLLHPFHVISAIIPFVYVSSKFITLY